MNKLVFLLAIGSSSVGKEQRLLLPLAESYEYQIIAGEGALSLQEYKEIFLKKGLLVQQLEIQRELMVFADEEALKEWIEAEMTPQDLDAESRARFVENYFDLMKEKGWLSSSDGKIRFPRQRLLVMLSEG